MPRKFEDLRRPLATPASPCPVLAVLRGNLARRRPPAAPYARGHTHLSRQRATRAQDGCDFDFPAGTAPSPEPAIH